MSYFAKRTKAGYDYEKAKETDFSKRGCARLNGRKCQLVKADDFINGADISILDEMENSRAIYKINGIQKRSADHF